MRSRQRQAASIEFFESDVSQFTDEVGGTTSLVIGFSEQGRSRRVYETITSSETLRRVLGTPKTEAERYAYYAAKKVLDQRGRLMFVRIPYANEMEDKVPAVKYAIDEGTTAEYENDKVYIPTSIVTDAVRSNLGNMGLQSLTDIKDQLKVTTVKSGSNKVFPGFSTVTKLLCKDEKGALKPAGDVDILKAWDASSSSSARFAVLVDSEETLTPAGAGSEKCNADEDSRFIVVTNVIDKSFALKDLIKSNGKDFRDIDRTNATIKADLKTKVEAAIKKEEGFAEGVLVGDPTYTYTVDSVDYKTTEFKSFTDASGKTVEQAEGKFLTQGFKDGFYPTKIVVNVIAKATYKCKTSSSATKEYPSTALSDAAQYFETALTITGNEQTWSKYLRANGGNLNTASLFIESIIDTASIKGVDGIFGSGYTPAELNNVDRIVRIHRTDKNGYVDANIVEELRDGNYERISDPDFLGTTTGFVLVNSSNKVLGRDKYNNGGNEVLGIVPFVFTGFNKLAASRLITPNKENGNTSLYQAVQGFDVGAAAEAKRDVLSTTGFVKSAFTIGSFDVGDDTISNTVAAYLPTLVAGEGGKLPGSQMNQTAILVAELSVDPNYDNKVVVTARELFYGNWDSGSSTYLPNLVNENSEYVELFTNYTPTEPYTKDLENMLTVVTPTCESPSLKNFWFLEPTDAAVLGFREYQITKLIKYANIIGTLDSVYNQLGNIDECDIDVVVDGGLTSIANLCVRAMGGSDSAKGTKYNTKGDSSDDPYYVPTLLKGGDINGVNAIAVWKTVAAKLNAFCEVTRKDCIAYIDAPRNLTVNYNAPVVKKGGSKTVDMDVLPKLKYLTGLNSTYGTMNTTWVRLVDDFSGSQFWCPPSILKNEKTIWADKTYGYPWYVSTGTERGTMSDAIEASLIVTPAQEDIIYATGFNYVKSFKNDGIVLWGQKTLQSSANQSMLGRENVRRMFLYAERKCYKAVKKFLFKPITTALMNNVVDTLTPILQDIQDHEGCYDYKILCSNSNNSPESIMRNELRIGIAIHPTPLAEHILLTFLCVGLNVTITEELITANS